MPIHAPGFDDGDIDRIFSDLSDNSIPVKASGNKLIDSGMVVDSLVERIISSLGLEVPPGTLYIGEGTSLSAAVRAVNIRSSITGNTGLVLSQLYDDTDGFSDAFVYYGGTVDTVDLNDPPGTDEAATAQFTITSTADELITQIAIGTSNASESIPFEITLRTESHTGTVAFHLDGDVTTDSSGIATISLINDYNPLLLDSGTTLYATTSCGCLVGELDGAVFTPNIEITRIVVTRKPIALRSDIAALGEVRMFDISRSNAVTKSSLIAAGWAICDGTTPAAQGITSPTITTTPNLEHKFVRMSDNETSGDTGGEESHTLTIAEMPAHTHDVGCSTSTGTTSARCGANGDYFASQSTGGGDAHNNLPPYYELAYFIKVKQIV